MFDLDGVLIDSESAWASVREELTRESGGEWHQGAQEEMMGMSSREWSRHMHERLRVPMEPDEISAAVVARLARRFRDQVPLLPHAVEAVRAAADRWPLAVASSSNRPLIELVLELTRMAPLFRATVSSEEVPHGKPAPDVYVEAARRLRIPPRRCAAVEDSTNGIRSAKEAGMRVVAVPRPDFPPSAEALRDADSVLSSLGELAAALAES
ncbi:MAG TPA: HAD family phosphatase [Solirubrobacterales bacterium]|nr:HAD family phosphatase [Solirubrobacterales bacterium]